VSETPRAVHTYMIEAFRMRIGHPLTLSDGEQIVDVLECGHPPGLPRDVDLTVLVEMPTPAPAVPLPDDRSLGERLGLSPTAAFLAGLDRATDRKPR
jgi:hypothetical protein